MKRLIILITGLSIFLVACGAEIESNISSEVEAFSFTTQDNGTLALADLEGEWWIADFIFTNCETVCLPMTANMSALQDRMAEEGLDAQLVSFSVDPEKDTPEVLKAYAESYNANLDNWTFLTGYDFETIQELSVQSFLSGLQVSEEDPDEVMHGTRFYLVNPDGEIIKHYDGVQSAAMEVIIEDLKIALN